MLFSVYSFSARKHKSSFCVVILALCWLTGFFLGAYFASVSFSQFTPMMCTLFLHRVSIVGTLAVFLFPLLLSAVLAHYSAHMLLCLFAFLKAFCFSFSSCCILFCFGTAGWLLQTLLMLPNTVLMIVLLWFWFRFLIGVGSLVNDTGICCIIIVGTACINHYILSPFLASLF